MPEQPEIKIVEYERKYAAAVAEMWNRSASEWGGFGSLYDEERIIAENEDSDNIKVYLALDDQQVVGYCSFAEYRSDKGASYIPLLNVRPDYHGKKVGKLLILKAVEQAIASQWTRLDLYTWPGNVKAVPLYKKCGFFWEKRDDETHLMNFLPYVMNTEAVEDFFSHADWYADSVKHIEVKPDGREENRFEYLDYHWQKDDRLLHMEFERRGRGLRLIETEDYLVSATVEHLKLVFDRQYKVVYRVVNKSGAPLKLKISGKDDENIRFDLDRELVLDEKGQEEVVEAEFYVGPVEEEQKEWRTHPGVVADLLINDKHALFKVGVVPQFPAAMEAVVSQREAVAGRPWAVYLDMENNFRQRASFQIELPESPMVDLPTRQHSVELAPGEKTSLEMPGKLVRPGWYSGQAKVVATPQGGEPVEYQQQLNALLPGAGFAFGGENKDYWMAYNGRFFVRLRKSDNYFAVGSLAQDREITSFQYPMVGPPWTVEMARVKPRVEFSENGREITMKATFASQALSGLDVAAVFTLHADGMAEHRMVLENRSDKPLESKCRIGMIQEFSGALLPLSQGVVEVDGSYGRDVDSFSLEKLTESWLFIRQRETSRGICWPVKWQPRFVDYLWQFEQDMGTLAPGEVAETESLVIAINTWQRWQDFRRYATGHKEEMLARHNMELDINGHNPFVGQKFPVVVREHKASVFDGAIEISSQQGLVAPLAVKHGAAEKVRQAEFSLGTQGEQWLDQLEMKVDFSSVSFSRRQAIMQPRGSVSTGTRDQQGKEVLTVDNGAIEFTAAPDYAPMVFSLKHQGVEWLASSFPEPCACSWWNPWLGGLGYALEDEISALSLLEEKSSAGFVSMEDNKGNKWQGLEITTSFEKHEKYRGLEWRQYALTLPGLPVLCSVIKMTNNTGRVLVDSPLVMETFLQPQGGWMTERTPAGSSVTYHLSPEAGAMARGTETLHFGNGMSQQVAQYFTNGRVLSYINPHVVHPFVPRDMTLADGQGKFSQPIFVMLMDEPLSANALVDLKTISF